MRTLTCVPAYLYPKQRLACRRCQIVPGVTVVELSGGLKKAIRSSSDRLPVNPEFGMTHAICIEQDVYLERLEDRLSVEGQTLPNNTFIEPEAIAKQAVLSFILAGRISFMFRGAHGVTVTDNGRKRSYLASGYTHGPLYQLSVAMQSALLRETGGWPAIDPRRVRTIAGVLDRYFRSGVWWTDRLAMAIGYFWDALCTPSSQQAFLGLSNSLESLLSTQSTEITHILAERIAVLTEPTPEQRLQAYRQVKELYKLRSKIVHGKAFPRKGKQNWATLLVSAKWSNVPISSLGMLVNITIAAIMAVLCNETLRKMVQEKRKEQKISEDLDEYFAEALFRT